MPSSLSETSKYMGLQIAACITNVGEYLHVNNLGRFGDSFCSMHDSSTRIQQDYLGTASHFVICLPCLGSIRFN